MVSVASRDIGPRVQILARSKAETISYNVIITFAYLARDAIEREDIKVDEFKRLLTWLDEQFRFVSVVGNGRFP